MPTEDLTGWHGGCSKALPGLPDIELWGPAERLRSSFINGIKHMLMTYTAKV